MGNIKRSAVVDIRSGIGDWISSLRRYLHLRRKTVTLCVSFEFHQRTFVKLPGLEGGSQLSSFGASYWVAPRQYRECCSGTIRNLAN
jgi:hypothetical protein